MARVQPQHFADTESTPDFTMPEMMLSKHLAETVAALSGIDPILLLSLVSHGVIALALYALVLALRRMK